ncbi:MAG: hydrolase [Clostridiales bacterium]|nr:hydrolase [Clostridiales bacterium]
MNKLMINKEEAVLVLIDFQERIMPAMHNKEELEKTVERLVKGCKILDIPVVVTQQYTRGLGPTIPSLHEALGDYNPIEKTSFSAMGEPEFEKELKRLGRKTIILTGIETHVCVQQTALDLIDKGYEVFLVEDCVSSRSINDKKYAIKRMTQVGAICTTYEAVLFEILKDAKAENFKQISALVK